MSLRKTASGLVLILIVFILAGGGLWASRMTAPMDSDSKEKLVIDITRRQTPREIAKTLESKGIVESAENLLLLGRLTRRWSKLKAGEYEVSPAMSGIEILRTITSGISLNHPITVRPGENMYEVAADLEAKTLSEKDRVVALCKDAAFIQLIWQQYNLGTPAPPTLEGYLYPDTYFINRTMTAEDILKQMIRRGLSVWTEREATRAKELGYNRHQVMTLASMIEKETGASQERPMISSVFHNRLKKRMRLQSDPTTIYGIWERYEGNIRRSDLQAKNDYNTYTIPALPIGPISNPGKEAIQAALFPAQSEFLFFVSHNDGTHEFTKTFAEHDQAVKKFQLDPNARAGKSWRDLSKSSADQN